MALNGSNNEQKIWNYFISKGLSESGCAGLMGNLNAESGLSPTNLQNTYEKKLGYTDTSYTTAVDNGSYTNFINDGAGYGLAQWTFWSRKQALLEYAKSVSKSIGDLEMQLDFLYKEISGNATIFNVLKNAKSTILEASNVVLLNYERPADQSVSVQNKRASYGQTYYDKYTKGNNSVSNTFTPRLTKPEKGNKYYNTKANGGYSNAIKGSPTDKDCDVLANCVGYAVGRFNEIGGYGSCKYLSSVNAENFMQYAGGLKTGQTPKLGACMVWQKGATLNGSDGAGHVAIVEKIISDTEIVTSESGYGCSPSFWTKTRKKGNGNWGADSSYKFLGFIYNPAVADNAIVTTPKEEQPLEDLLYKVGDIVDFTGTTHYTSTSSTSGVVCKPGVAKVSSIYKSGKHPYHLIAQSGGSSNVYGWVDANTIKGIHKETNNQNNGGSDMGYTNSSLVDCTVKSPNHSGTRTHKIDRITPHCVVGQLTAESIGGCFSSTSREASCNYGIGKDGRVCLVVDEKNRSWCSSSNANDQRAITIECASDATEPYAFNTAVYNKLVKLCIDICKRNGLTKVLWFNDKDKSLNYEPKSGECVLTVHRWFANKSCPGTWMYTRMGQLADEINKGLGNNVTTTPPSNPQPTPSTGNTTLKYAVGDIVDFTGNTHYTSSSSSSGVSCKPGVAKVTAVSKGSKHPYHLVRESNGGSTVYGWVDENSISRKHSTSSNNKHSTPSVTEVVAGTKLTLNNVSLYGSSATKTKAGTKTGTYYAWNKDVVNGRIRITNSPANVGKNGQVTGWIDYEDAKKAAGVTSSGSSGSSFKAYTVQVTTNVLNIRKGAGTNYGVAGSIKDKGVYTIVEEANGTGATKWGRLKSGAGWISLDYCKKL